MLTTSDINEWTRASIHARQVSTGTWTSSGQRGAEETGTPEAEQSWRALLRVLQTSADPEVHSALATGPLRRLIEQASGQFIDRIERAAWSNPEFCKLLALAWECAPTDIWARIDAVRSVEVARRLAAGHGAPGR